MTLFLFNTLSQSISEFVPLEGNRVRMYTCGPTVYNFVHIGNLRTFIFQDILRRYLIYKGFELTHVMNITDVEDKIIAAAADQGMGIQSYTEKYTNAFLEDMETLRIEKPDEMPRATDHIPEMVELINRLADKGLTYQRDGSTYFRIDRFPNYGKLARLEPNEVSSGMRCDVDEYSKEDSRDFVLWKAQKPGEFHWDNGLGPGRPGWHVECSAMSMKYLGESFDIHCGGVDLIFPHHENELAQSEGATGRPFVKYWVHSAHLIVDSEKMSKSQGNFYTLRDLLGMGFGAIAIRYLLASVRYRTQLNFTFEGLAQASQAVQRVNDFLQKVREIPDRDFEDESLGESLSVAREGFEQGMDNDLNTSKALAALFIFIREVNPLLEKGDLGSSNKWAILEFFSSVNTVFATFQVEEDDIDDDQISVLITEREQARLNRDYRRADEIRQQLGEKGVVLEDTKEGTRWKKPNY
jgi:cysteinyl-tRNA synthetase